MQSQPDWGKRGVYVALILGIPSFVLALFAYVRPPDPAHPIRFDFLFHTVAIPVWLIVSLLIIAIVLSLAYRILTPRISQTLTKKLEAVEVKASHLPTTPSTPSIHVVAKAGELVIPTADNLEIHIKALDPNVILRIDNNRLDAIHHIDVIVHTAYSFDSRHNQFRTHPAAGGLRTLLPDLVNPSDSSGSIILVHHPSGKDHLLLGSDASRVMKWPDNDKANIQRWKLNVSFGAKAYSPTIPPTGPVFQLTKFDLIVEWNKISNQLSVEKA